MKKIFSALLIATLVLSMFAFPVSAADAPELLTNSNPIVKTIYTADPSAHVWPTNPNKLYLYPSHDQDPANGCDYMDMYHVYSTEDMVNWVDEGEIIRSEEVAWGRSEGGFMWAPDAAYRDGTYYFYYPHPTRTDWGSSWEIGVATSKYPDRGFIDQGIMVGATTPIDGSVKPGDGMIDPQVFIDDDGTPYLFTGGSSRCWYAEMNPDMKSLKPVEVDGEMKVGLTRIPAAQVPDYHEGPWVFKRGDTYYLTYPDNGGLTIDGKKSNRMRYSTSKSVHGPWEPQGFFHNPVNTGDTSHGSVVEFKGRWFLFYHNAVVSNGRGNLRSVAVDEMFFNEDGTIQTVTQTTTGPAPIEGVTYTPAPSTAYPAESAVRAGGSGVTLSENAGWPLGQVVDGLTTATRSLTFNNVDGGLGGRATISIRYAADAKRSFRLFVNGYDWGNINLFATSGINVFDREAPFTVTNMKPGATNTIQLVGRPTDSNNSHTAGACNIAQISVSNFNDYDIINPAGQATINSVSVTSPLAAGNAARIFYDVTGENLAGKTLQLYLFGMDPVQVKANANGVASGIINISDTFMADSTNKLDAATIQKDTIFNLGVKVMGEKALAYAPITVMPTKDIWKIWSENADGKLRLKFNTDISASRITTVKVGEEDYSAALDGNNSILVDVAFDTLTVKQDELGGKEPHDGTQIIVGGLKYPMYISYSFRITSEVQVAPELKDYSASLATLGGAATRGNNGSSPTGVVIENLSNANSYAEWNIPAADVVKTGEYVLGVYYGTNDSAPSCNVIVNGETLSGRLSMPGTGGWSNFTGKAEKNITLTEGQDNTVRLAIGSSSGQGFNVYKISLTRIP